MGIAVKVFRFKKIKFGDFIDLKQELTGVNIGIRPVDYNQKNCCQWQQPFQQLIVIPTCLYRAFRHEAMFVQLTTQMVFCCQFGREAQELEFDGYLQSSA